MRMNPHRRHDDINRVAEVLTVLTVLAVVAIVLLACWWRP